MFDRPTLDLSKCMWQRKYGINATITYQVHGTYVERYIYYVNTWNKTLVYIIII